MRLVSVNVGRPRLAVWRGRTVSTGIFKEPAAGRVMLRRLNLDGDRQADLTVHGGHDKAVYAYPSEHYARWRAALSDPRLAYGGFGENFTTEGLAEASVSIGDRFRVGTAEVVVTEPRMPCYKLGVRFGRSDIIKRFLASGRTGFYFSVAREGEVGAGDRVELIERATHGITIADITRLYARDRDDLETMRRAVEIEVLPEGWRDYFRQRLG